MTVREFFDRGNVTRDRFPGKEQLPIYLGSGRAGVCLDGYGLMNPELLPDTQRNQPLAYKTACHYGKGAFELDAWMPLYRLRFEKLPELARALGRASYEFKKAKEDIIRESSELADAAEKAAEKDSGTDVSKEG